MQQAKVKPTKQAKEIKVKKLSRTEQIEKDFPKIKVSELINKDPTENNAYIYWMAKQLDAGISSKEDLWGTILSFHKMKDRLPSDKRDIYQYESVSILENKLKDLGDSKRQQKSVIKQSTHIVYEDDTCTVYRIDSLKACMLYGKGTRWCICMGNGTYYRQYYTGGSRMYFLLDKKRPEIKMCLQVKGTNSDPEYSLWYENDANTPIHYFERMYDDYKTIYENIKKDLPSFPSYQQLRAGTADQQVAVRFGMLNTWMLSTVFRKCSVVLDQEIINIINEQELNDKKEIIKHMGYDAFKKSTIKITDKAFLDLMATCLTGKNLAEFSVDHPEYLSQTISRIYIAQLTKKYMERFSAEIKLDILNQKTVPDKLLVVLRVDEDEAVNDKAREIYLKNLEIKKKIAASKKKKEAIKAKSYVKMFSPLEIEQMIDSAIKKALAKTKVEEKKI